MSFPPSSRVNMLKPALGPRVLAHARVIQAGRHAGHLSGRGADGAGGRRTGVVAVMTATLACVSGTTDVVD